MNIVCLSRHDGALIMYTNGHTFTAYTADSSLSDRAVFELGFNSLADVVAVSLSTDIKHIMRTCVKADAVVVMYGGDVSSLVEEFPLLKIAKMYSFADEIATGLANVLGARACSVYALADAACADYDIEHTPQGFCDMLGTVVHSEKAIDLMQSLRGVDIFRAVVSGRTYDDKEALKTAGFVWCGSDKRWERVVFGEDEADTVREWVEYFFAHSDVAHSVEIVSRKDAWK